MADTDAVVAKYRLTPGMLLKGHWVLKRRRTLLVGLLYLAVGTLWILTCLESKWFLAVVGGAVMLWLLYAHAYLLHPWLYYKALVREPNMAGNLVMQADEGGIRGSNGQVESHFEWSCLTRFVECRDLFVLRFGKKQMTVVPKSGFEGEHGIARFRSLLTRNVGSRASGG